MSDKTIYRYLTGIMYDEDLYQEKSKNFYVSYFVFLFFYFFCLLLSYMLYKK